MPPEILDAFFVGCEQALEFFGHAVQFLSVFGMAGQGTVMTPARADSATVAGLARYTSDRGEPIRPLKFRLVVEMQTSPSARMP